MQQPQQLASSSRVASLPSHRPAHTTPTLNAHVAPSGPAHHADQYAPHDHDAELFDPHRHLQVAGSAGAEGDAEGYDGVSYGDAQEHGQYLEEGDQQGYPAQARGAYDEHGRFHPYTDDYTAPGRGPTPESEIGEAALTLWKNPTHKNNNAVKEGYAINQFATQTVGIYGTGEEDKGVSQYGQEGQVEEPASPAPSLRTQWQGSTDNISNNNPHPGASGPAHAPKQGKPSKVHQQFVQPQQVPRAGGESSGGETPSKKVDTPSHVRVEDIGGRRIPTKRSGSKRTLWDGEDEDAEDRQREEVGNVEEFDPTAPIEKFNTKEVLVGKWDTIQKDMVPVLRDFATHKFEQAFDEVLTVVSLFQQLNDEARAELEEGVGKIEAEEKKQEEARAVIVEFSNQMKLVAQRLSGFGGMMAAVVGPAVAGAAGQGSAAA